MTIMISIYQSYVIKHHFGIVGLYLLLFFYQTCSFKSRFFMPYWIETKQHVWTLKKLFLSFVSLHLIATLHISIILMNIFVCMVSILINFVFVNAQTHFLANRAVGFGILIWPSTVLWLQGSNSTSINITPIHEVSGTLVPWPRNLANRTAVWGPKRILLVQVMFMSRLETHSWKMTQRMIIFLLMSRLKTHKWKMTQRLIIFVFV